MIPLVSAILDATQPTTDSVRLACCALDGLLENGQETNVHVMTWLSITLQTLAQSLSVEPFDHSSHLNVARHNWKLNMGI